MTENTPGSVHRRTVVAGAAWTIPVVATAIGAPLAAASGDTPTLAFTNGPYSVAACGTLKDVVIKATTDGTTPPPSNTPVTVTLPAGLTWSNGETGSRALPTDGNGEVVLSGLKATGTPGTGTITAATSSNSAAAPVTVSGGASHIYILTSGSAPYNGVLTGVPGGSTPIGSGFWLKDGTIRSQDGAVIATNVVNSAADFTNWGSANQSRLTWTDTAGVAHLVIQTSGNAPYTGVLSGVPAGATPVGTLFWLKDGTVYGQDGAVISTGVTSSGASFNNWGSGNQSVLGYATGATC